VAALAATTGPRVAKNPIVEAKPTMPATEGPRMIESITGTWEAKVAEYPIVGMTNWSVPRKARGMANAKAVKTLPRASSTLLKSHHLVPQHFHSFQSLLFYENHSKYLKGKIKLPCLFSFAQNRLAKLGFWLKTLG